MYKRLIVLTVIIAIALGGMTLLGYHSIRLWAKGLKGERLGEFAATAEAIKQNVNRKLDEFMQREQNRPYTDYQYYYVPENIKDDQQQMPLLRSPLAGQLYNDFAYGNFQIDPDGTIVTPYYSAEQTQAAQQDKLYREVEIQIDNIKQNLMPVLASASGSFGLPGSSQITEDQEIKKATEGFTAAGKETLGLKRESAEKKGDYKIPTIGKAGRSKELAIESLQQESQKAQVYTQRRSVVASNVSQSIAPARATGQVELRQGDAANSEEPAQRGRAVMTDALAQRQEYDLSESEYRPQGGRDDIQATQPQIPEPQQLNNLQQVQMEQENETVQIKIEPFVPVVVAAQDARESVFGGQVFLLRHVQIEDKHFLQGFQLDEKRLIDEVKESAAQEISTRERMSFEVPQAKDVAGADAAFKTGEVAYTAILDFGFGDLVLNLIETDPAWIGKKINWLEKWYLGIIGIVFLAVTLGMVSLWLNARAQLKLAQKKDDFISAVSHELRTPLTSIRMYSEMLEKNWVKSQDKLDEYYRSMRQESERLSRLIENVLDFSRIQRGRKKYAFNLGDINECVSNVVEMMKPYAGQHGFAIRKQMGQLGQTAFDRDAVTQIIVNLLDNAIKYARNAEDKTIIIRTKSDGRHILIEVEDHGPGVPHRQRKKIFEEFYRIGTEATRETAGTGLGLALVKKFAQAHNGFVEILSARPTGAIFRVALAAQS